MLSALSVLLSEEAAELSDLLSSLLAVLSDDTVRPPLAASGSLFDAALSAEQPLAAIVYKITADIITAFNRFLFIAILSFYSFFLPQLTQYRLLILLYVPQLLQLQ